MVQPEWLCGREHRRDGVAVDGDEAWALFTAAADGDEERVQELVDASPDLVHAQVWYQKPIDLAIREGQVGVVSIILDAEGSRRFGEWIYSGYSYRPHRTEVQRRGFRELDAFLMKYKRRLAPRFSEEFESIREAISSRDVSVVESVLSENPRLLHESDLQGNGVLHWAVMTGQLEMLEFFITRGAEIDAESACGRTAMELALSRHLHLAAFLFAHGAKAGLHSACALGLYQRALHLLLRDPGSAGRLDRNGRSPLTYAAGNGHGRLVKLLLDEGADPSMPECDAADGAALAAACGFPYESIVKLLLEAGADPNAEIDSSGCCLSQLVDAEKWGNNPAQRCSDLLRAHGAFDPPWAMDRDSMLAAIDRDDPLLYRRFDGGWAEFHLHITDVEILDRYVETAGNERIQRRAYTDAYSKNHDFLRRLLHHGVDPSLGDWLGRTALHACAEKGDIEAARIVIEHGASLDPIDVNDSTTPLGYAAREGEVEMVRFLLGRGADPGAPAHRPWARPAAYAELNGQPEVLELLP